jgi:hypothetical protein
MVPPSMMPDWSGWLRDLTMESLWIPSSQPLSVPDLSILDRPAKVKCGTCNGSGLERVPLPVRYSGRSSMIETTCHVCGGTGEINR